MDPGKKQKPEILLNGGGFSSDKMERGSIYGSGFNQMQSRNMDNLSNELQQSDSMEESKDAGSIAGSQPLYSNYLPNPSGELPSLSNKRLSKFGGRIGLSEGNKRMISEQGIKTGLQQPEIVGTKTRKENVIHAADRFIVNDANPSYQLPFVFTEEEIKDSFETLDIHHNGHITKDELSFFLDILGEQVSEAELDEMIRMLDIEGTKKVYFEEFKRMATGKSLSPIGIAYPPTIPLLQKQNLNKLSNAETVNKMKEKNDQVGFIKDKDGRQEGYGGQKRQGIDKTGKEGGSKKLEYQQREKLIRAAMEETKIDIGKSILNLRKKKQSEVVQCTVQTFAAILDRSDDEKTKRVFEALTPGKGRYFDVREFIANCVALNGWSNQEKATVVFSILDHENTNYIFFEDFVRLILWLNLEQSNASKYKIVEKTVTKIFEERKIKLNAPLSQPVFKSIISDHQSVLFTHRFN